MEKNRKKTKKKKDRWWFTNKALLSLWVVLYFVEGNVIHNRYLSMHTPFKTTRLT